MANDGRDAAGAGAPPPLSGVLETVLYYDRDREEPVRRFYGEVLGFRLLEHAPGRHLFYRAGSSVFLLFEADDAGAKSSPPPHGARGPVHTCFRVPPAAYEAWKRHLARRRVEVVHEARWKRGRSFYFRDPAGNLLEIADADIWPRG